MSESALEFWGWVVWLIIHPLSVSRPLGNNVPHLVLNFCGGQVCLQLAGAWATLGGRQSILGPCSGTGANCHKVTCNYINKALYPSAKGSHIQTTCWKWCQGCTNPWTMLGKVLFGTDQSCAWNYSNSVILQYSWWTSPVQELSLTLFNLLVYSPRHWLNKTVPRILCITEASSSFQSSVAGRGWTLLSGLHAV